jgi:glycosyltransferase involved in cell wall biosynthesis
MNYAKINIIAVSKDLERLLIHSFPKATVTQIYNAIQIYNKKLIFEKDIRKKSNINDDVFWIGTVARLSEPKNLELLIDAGKLLMLSEINFKISIWGEGPLRNKLQNRIDANNLQNLISLDGFEKNILPFLASLDLFVLCSLHEGLPMSLLEAMTMEIPVVCTEVGGIKEIITDGFSGLLVQNNDPISLTNAITKLQQDKTLRKKLVANAKIKIEQEFNIETTINKLIDLYRTILKN